MSHNRWLHWKIEHGLATRGRVGGKLHPKGLIAGVLYKLFFKRNDPGALKVDEPEMFKQSIGGAVGASGKTNEV